MGAHQIYRSSSWLCNAMTRRRVHGEVGGIQATFLVGFTMLLPSYHAETRVLVLVSPFFACLLRRMCVRAPACPK
eukprot:m.126026 g.126026  ORF g.126026 m.126026 type:complete len:75 (-) comp11181_c0_seq1:144-368(-)